MYLHSVICLLLAAVASVFTVDYNGLFQEAEKTGGLRIRDRQLILNAHNHFRRLVALGLYRGQPSAAGMPLMLWDDRLAARALGWAKVLRHRPKISHNLDTERMDWIGIGENIGRYNEQANLLSQVDAFFDEATFYNYEQDSCDVTDTRNIAGTCGHYFQSAHARSIYVGCQSQTHNVTNHFILVCNYGPGTIVGRIYEAGEPCSNCMGDFPWCINGTCVSKDICEQTGKCECKNKCTNGAELDPETCTCTKNCPAGQNCHPPKKWRKIKQAVNYLNFPPEAPKDSKCQDFVGNPDVCNRSDLYVNCFDKYSAFIGACPRSCNTCSLMGFNEDALAKETCLNQVKAAGYCKVKVFGEMICPKTCG